MMRWARDWNASGTSTEREMFSRIAFCISSSLDPIQRLRLRVLVLGHRAGEAADPPRGDRRQDQDDDPAATACSTATGRCGTPPAIAHEAPSTTANAATRDQMAQTATADAVDSLWKSLCSCSEL